MKELENRQKAEVEQLYDDISQRAENAQVDGMVTVEKDEGNQYVKISIGGAILFNSGEADLKKDAKAILSKVGDILKLYDSHLIKIEGHTDNVPITSGKFRSNLQLSLARAESVFEYMESQKKLNPVTLEASGRGEYIPISDNQTVEGRAKNRRVEFKIYTESAK